MRHLISEDEMRRFLTAKSEDPAAIENGTADFYLDQIPRVCPGFRLEIGPYSWVVQERRARI
jgi:hypothetical protein